MMLFTSAFECAIRFPVDYLSGARRQENCALRVRRHRVLVLIDDQVALRAAALVSKIESQTESAAADGELKCERDPSVSNRDASSPITSTSPINGSAAHADAITRPVSQCERERLQMRMNEGFCIFALALLVSAGSVTRAEAIPVVSLGGIPGSWNSGDSFSVDVIVTGLYQITTGVNLDVDFNTTLSGTGYAFGATAFINPLDGINGSDSSGGFAGNLVSLNWTSFHAHADLTGAQGPFPSGPLVLATVDFVATGTGTP